MVWRPWQYRCQGTPCFSTEEPGNVHDRNCIKVILTCSHLLGHLEAHLAIGMSALLCNHAVVIDGKSPELVQEHGMHFLSLLRSLVITAEYSTSLLRSWRYFRAVDVRLCVRGGVLNLQHVRSAFSVLPVRELQFRYASLPSPPQRLSTMLHTSSPHYSQDPTNSHP